MITLTGSTSISTLKKQIQSPQDAVDNVEQISVQPAVQDLLNNIYCTIDKLPYLKPSLSMYSIDGATIVVKPFAGLWASKFAATSEYTVLSTTTDTLVTSAKLSPAGSFAADTIYYLYAYLNGAVTDFVIRTDAPDATKTYSLNGAVPRLNERYIGSFIVQAGPAVVLFKMSNGDYSFPTDYNYGVYNSPVLTDAVITFLPPTATMAKVKTLATNTHATDVSVIKIYPKTVLQYHTVNVAPKTDIISGHSYIELPTIGTPSNTFQISVTGGTGSTSLYYTGYTE